MRVNNKVFGRQRKVATKADGGKKGQEDTSKNQSKLSLIFSHKNTYVI